MSIQILGDGNPDGTSIVKSSTELVSLYGGTAVAQQSDASQVAFTDSSGGTVSDTLAAGVGKTLVAFKIDLATIADGDVITAITPGFKGKILSLDFFVDVAVTTAAKLSSLNVEIGTTNTTGGVVALTSANSTPKGAKVAGSAITAANTFTNTDTISIEASSTTAFVEGSGWIIISLQNMDVSDAIASIADKFNEIRSSLVNIGAITGAA